MSSHSSPHLFCLGPCPLPEGASNTLGATRRAGGGKQMVSYNSPLPCQLPCPHPTRSLNFSSPTPFPSSPPRTPT